MSLPQRIPGPQIISLRNILANGFSLPEFDDFLLGQFNLERPRITLGASLDVIVRDVVVYFDKRSTIPDLVTNARLVRPDDADLITFIEQHNGNPKLPGNTPAASQLERTIRESNSMLNVRGWTKRLATVQNQVCRVEIPIDGEPKPVFGTGFLIAPDVVITNYHVVEYLIDGTAKPAGVGLRFDYALLEDGATPDPGTVYRLAADWLIDASPYSPLDDEEHPASDPLPDQLDYALLRLASRVGDAKVGAALNNMATFQPRGWIKTPTTAYPFAPQSALYIMQHPEGDPLKLALDTDAVIGVNGNATRVRYKTNTERGSSGSPCFDANWNLVALHHGGDPNYKHKAQFNQGIPFAQIVELLKQRGKAGALGG
jgi:hypothetical protein